jgi:sugar/nucleoside kinase (ribokinase family)
MRQASYTNPFRSEGHHCPNVLLRCLDPRFHAALAEVLPTWLLEVSGSRKFASMALPGGAKAILDPPTRPVLFEALDTAIRALAANHLIIANHVDCRACGGSEEHGSPQDEEQFHLEQLRQAREVVKEAYPRLGVMLVYVSWESIREVEA